jgi:hypothetical protein
MIKVRLLRILQCRGLTLLLPQIWSMKKNEEAAAKAKPKTTAAQIRVQKGESSVGDDGVIGLR